MEEKKANSNYGNLLLLYPPYRVACGHQFTLAISDAGSLYAWGDNQRGKLGTNAGPEPQWKPVTVPIEAIAGAANQVASGNEFAAMIVINNTWDKNDAGSLLTWGLNNYGQLGVTIPGQGSVAEVGVPTLVSLPEKVKRVACGGEFTACISESGKVYSWGKGTFGNLGHGTTDNKSEPTLVQSLSDKIITFIACGSKHMLAVSGEKKVYSWGHGGQGRLGHNDVKGTASPKPIERFASEQIMIVACGESHSAAITTSGELFTWGAGSFGRLGHGETTDSLFPKVVDTLRGKRVYMIACGFRHCLALTIHGVVFAWGSSSYGATGLQDLNQTSAIPVPLPVRFLEGKRVTQVAVGPWHSIAITSMGEVFTWGYHGHGRLGLGTSVKVDQPFPALVPMEYIYGVTGGLKILEQIAKLTGSRKMTTEKTHSTPWKIVSVSCGSKHSMALTQGGSIWVWGDIRRGALGLGEEVKDHVYPMALHSLSQKTIKFVACGSEHSMAIASTGEVYTWGNGRLGQLGNGFLGFSYVPMVVQTLDGRGAFSGACGEDYTGVLTEIGEVYMFGNSDSGKLGLGQGPPQVLPKLIPALTGVKKLSAGLSHTAALTEDGVVYTWGGGFYGRLGHRSADNYYEPSQLTSRVIRQYADVSCGAYHTLVLDRFGSLYACGKSDLVCSDEDLLQITPMDCLSDKQFSLICAAEEHSLAVSKDGEVYVWGHNRYGKLGNKSEREDQLLPIRLPGLPMDIVTVSCYTNHTLVLTRSGDIYSWGCGGSGRLGYGDTSNVYYPKRMETRWTAVQDRDDDDQEDEANATEMLISLIDSGTQLTSFKEMMLVLSGEEKQNIESAIVVREAEIIAKLAGIVEFIRGSKKNQEAAEDLKASIEAKIMQRAYEIGIPPKDYMRVLIPHFLAENLFIYEEIVWVLQQQPCYLARLIRTMRRKGAKDIPRVIRSLRFIFSNINTKGKFLHVDKNADSLLFLGLCKQVFSGEVETATSLSDLFSNPNSPAVEMLLTFFSREAGSELLFKMFQKPLQNYLEMISALGDEGLIIDPLELARLQKTDTSLETIVSDKKLKAQLRERLLYFIKGLGYFLDTIKSTPAHLPAPVKILLKYAFDLMSQKVWLNEAYSTKAEETKLYLQAILRLFVLNVFVPVIRAPEQEGLFVEQITDKQRQALVLACDAIRKVVEKSTYIGEMYESVNVFLSEAHTHLLEAMEASFDVEDTSEVDLVVTLLMQHFDYSDTFVHFNVNELTFLVLTLVKYKANVRLKSDNTDYLYGLIEKLGNLGEEVVISEENFKVNLKLKTKFLLSDSHLVTCKLCETPMPDYLAISDTRTAFIRLLPKTEPDSALLALEEACRRLPKFSAYSLAEVESKLKTIIDVQLANNSPNYDIVFVTKKAQEKVTELMNRDISLENVLADISKRFRSRKSQGFYLRRISEGIQVLQNAQELFLDFCRTQQNDLETALSNIDNFKLNFKPTEKEAKKLTQTRLLGFHLRNLKRRNVQNLPTDVTHDIVGSVSIRDLEKFGILEELTAAFDLSQRKHMEFHFSHSRDQGWHFELIFKSRAGNDLLGQFNMTNEQYFDLKRTANSEAKTLIPGVGRFKTGPLLIFLNSKIRLLTV